MPMNLPVNPLFWRRQPQVSVRRDGDQSIFYDPDTQREKVVNATGLTLWMAMDGTRDVGGLAEALSEAYDAPSVACLHDDVAAFAEELRRDGLATAVPMAADRPLPSEEYAEVGQSPLEFDLSLTGRCNLHCRYCFYADEMTGRRDLPEACWQAFFDELGGLAVRNTTLSGGEVFTRPDLWSLIDGVIRNRMRFAILSNGTLLDEATVAELVRRRHRLNHVQVSIDGASAAVHDRSRGEGSFVRAVAGFRRLREASLPAIVRLTINRHNVDEIEAVATFLLEDLGLPSFSCNEAIPLGAGCSVRDGATLSTAEKIRAMRAMERAEARYPGRINATAGPWVNLRRFREMERARVTGWRPSHWHMGTLSACGCAHGKLAIHHDGVIAPCNMLAIELGRIGQDRLVDIWKRHPVLEAMRQRGTVNMREVPECQDCEWAEVCNGSCPSTAYARTGTLLSANLDDCYREFLKDVSPTVRDELFAWRGEEEEGGEAVRR